MKNQTFTAATKPQVQKANVLLNKLGLKTEKDSFAMQFSSGRTTHVSELSIKEASNLIQYLVNQEPAEKLRNAILQLGYRCGLLYGTTAEDKKMNPAKLDGFLLSRGSVKKKFYEMGVQELKQTQKQFEAMLRANEYTKAGKIAKKELGGLGISFASDRH